MKETFVRISISGNGSFCDSMLASFPTIRHVRPEVVFSTTFLVTSREVVAPSGKSLGNTEGSLTRRGLSSTTLMTLYALPQDFLAFAPQKDGLKPLSE
ncbi:hypothetical protein V1478_011597 [Vespula squamosa]|uniref:Uncharacterized protein n=1 Tax=Vespula squamosa TaxID=30214 RepID=A0ABD2AEY8_VESSQ